MYEDLYFEKLYDSEDTNYGEFRLYYKSIKLDFYQDFYMSNKDFNNIVSVLSGETKSCTFGNLTQDSEFCQMTTKQITSGKIIIILNIKIYLSELTNNYFSLQSLNVPVSIEPAVLDRIIPKIRSYFNKPCGTKLSLLYDEPKYDD